MKNFMAPMLVFVIGNITLLVVTLFLPAVDTQVATLASDTEEIASNFWGWEWLMTSGVVRWITYIIFEGFILWATGKAFLARRRSY